MRMLTELEMDAIFGGDGVNTTTLPNVVVTANRIQSTGGYYISGWSSFAGSYDENGQSNSCYYSSPYAALPPSQVASPAGLRCVLAAAAVPGYTFAPNVNLQIMNSYGFREETPGAPNYNGYVLSNSYVMPAGYDRGMGGNTLSGGPTTYVYIYAGGMSGGMGHAYTDPITNVSYPNGIGALNNREAAINTAAHEAAHSRGISSELLAEGYAARAVMNYRAGAGTSCPQ